MTLRPSFIRRTTEPSSEPLTTSEAKAQLRVGYSNEDTLIAAYLTAARKAVESYARISIMPQVYEFGFRDWPTQEDALRLLMGPVRSIASVKYRAATATDATLTTLSDTLYSLEDDAADHRVIFYDCAALPDLWSEWPGARVIVTANTGFADAASVPEDIKQAIRLTLTNSFVNRMPAAGQQLVIEDGRLSSAVRALMAPYRTPNI